MSLRLAIFNDGQLPLPPVKGGSVPTLIEMILLENEKQHDFDIDVFSCFDKDAIEKSKSYVFTHFYYSHSFRIIRFLTNVTFKTKIPFVNLKAIPLPQAFIKAIKKNNYDVILVSGYIRGALTIFKYAKNDNCLKILAHHTVTDILHEPSVDGVAIYKYSDVLTFDSEYATKYACTGTKEQNNKNYAHQDSIPNLEKYSLNLDDNRLAVRKKYGIDNDDFVILFVGRIVEYKGIYELIEAFNSVSETHKNIKLLICGASSYSKKIKKGNLRKLLSVIESKPNIILTGYVNYDDVYKIYQASDITALVTKIDEGFGMVGIESLAAGKPLITTRTGGVAEYSNDTNSILVRRDENMINDIIDAIVKCLNNPTLVANLGKCGREQVSVYSQDNYYKRFKEIVFKNIKRK